MKKENILPSPVARSNGRNVSISFSTGESYPTQRLRLLFSIFFCQLSRLIKHY
jgi:hypothetical protein